MPIFSPFRIILIFSLASIIALFFIPKLSVDLQPSPAVHSLTITYSLPDASPEIVEAQATAPLENVLSQLTNLKKISSISRYHQGSITLVFDPNAHLDFKRFEVSALIRQVYPRLPPTLSYPQINVGASKKSQQKFPLLTFTINAPFATAQIQQTAQEILQKPLALLSEVEEISILGATPLQVVVEYDADKMQNYQITREQLVRTLQAHTQTHFLNNIQTPTHQTLHLVLKNNVQSIRDFEDIVIHQIQSPNTQNRALIRLKDVAQVFQEEQRPNSYYRINGLNAVTLNVFARAGVNEITLGKTIRQKMEHLKQNLPNSYEVLLEYDDTEYLSQELDKIYVRSGLSVLILILLILLWQRNLRYLLVLFVCVVFNTCLTLFLAYILGISIHLYSLAGLTLSFGLIIDNAVVMLDHLRKYQNSKVLRALLGATLTTLAALALIFALPEEDRQNLAEFALIIILNLAVSLLLAWLFIPAMYQVLFQANPSKSKRWKVNRWYVYFWRFYNKIIHFFHRFRILYYTFWILLFGLPVFWLPTKIEGWESYNQTIGSDFYQENLSPYINKIFGGTLRLFANNVYEKSGFRSGEKTILYVNAEMPQGTTLAQMNDIIQKVENYLNDVKGLEKYVSQVFSGQNALIRISFDAQNEKGSLPYKLKNRLIAQSLDWSGVTWNIFGVGEGFHNSSDNQLAAFRVEMRGYNYLELERQADILAKKLLTHKRIQAVNTNERLDYSEKTGKIFSLKLSEQNALAYGIGLQEIYPKIVLQSEPTSPDFSLVLDNQYQSLSLRSEDAPRFSRFDLENLPYRQEIQSLQLSLLGRITTEQTSNALHKENRQYIRIVGFEYYGSPKFGEEFLLKVLNEMKSEMPAGFEAKKLGFDFFSWQQNQRRYGVLLILMGAIFIICAILFESFRQPFVVILTIPSSLIGLFLAFAWGEFYFDQGGYAAFFLVGGLVVNAAIFIVNDYNNLAHLKNDNFRLIKAIRGKAIPILLTIFSTVMGLVPFLTEGDTEIFWFSLAIGSIGGLIFSMIAVFLLLPVWMWKRYTLSLA